MNERMKNLFYNWLKSLKSILNVVDHIKTCLVDTIGVCVRSNIFI